MDLAAFRIVQESITNVVRHAGARQATIRLGRTAATSWSRWTTTAPTARGAARGPGRGIAGMTERARALGGSLEAGTRPGRGFRVRARLPLGGAT